MAAQVLEISKHGAADKPDGAPNPSRRGRLYRFPSRIAVEHPHPEAAAEPPTPHGRFPVYLGMELAIGLAVWVTWFLWRQFQ